LPGEWCDFGKAYTLGKADAMNVTLKSAEYTVGHVRLGGRFLWPNEGEKLLVIHYTLHNPLPREQHVSGATIAWTAVDAKSQNNNQEYLGVGVDDQAHNQLDQALKPAQKIEAFAIIRVAGEGAVPKLMAASGADAGAPVARYDLHGKVKPLPAPYADPSDQTGATVAKVIPGVFGTFYTTGNFDTKVEKADFATPPFADEGFDANNDYVVVTFECEYFGEGAGGMGGSGIGGAVHVGSAVSESSLTFTSCTVTGAAYGMSGAAGDGGAGGAGGPVNGSDVVGADGAPGSDGINGYPGVKGSAVNPQIDGATQPLPGLAVSKKSGSLAVGKKSVITLSVKSGTAPYKWQALSLPPGLALNTKTGKLSGKPTTAGTFTLAVLVTDSSSGTHRMGATKFSIKVAK